ncbi:MAG: YicC/YloC family endoribonuclease, partial [Parachlamydiaceae bacterium]|nr:YicC/YloC family endoribonuclease [Parachlamydiaceae bacterium]
GQFVIEIQSVNRKFLDLQIFIPKELSQFDVEIKEWISPHITRGQVIVKVSASFEDHLPFVVKVNLPLARQIKKAWLDIAKELGLPETEFQLSLLAEVKEVLQFQENVDDEENYRQTLKEIVDLALQDFLKMKEKEGFILACDIKNRIAHIKEIMKRIEEKSPGASNKYREKLLKRLNEIVPGFIENEERILREIALFAEKIDVVEEITRFYYHVNHLEEIIDSDAQSIGKTLEFVLQELNREINTLGSKSSDQEIARSVIDIKSELERIREQIQNIE